MRNAIILAAAVVALTGCPTTPTPEKAVELVPVVETTPPTPAVETTPVVEETPVVETTEGETAH